VGPLVRTVTGGVFFTVLPALFGLYIHSRVQLIQALTERAERAERSRSCWPSRPAPTSG